MTSFRPARVLIDWHNVQSRVDEDFHLNPRKRIPALILRIQQQVAKALARMDSTVRYRASLRIYHGWHDKREPTPIRADFEIFRFCSSFARRIGNVSFVAGFEFGNELCCYNESMPLYDTYRGKGQAIGQKMVDTSIICDLLYLGRASSDFSGVIVSDDDDFIPAILMAKIWQIRGSLVRVESRDTRCITDESLVNDIFYWSES